MRVIHVLYYTSLDRKKNSVIMRKQAKKMGLNENELYDSKTKSKINVSSEKDICNKLNLEYLEPKSKIINFFSYNNVNFFGYILI